jgi:RNA polymerase sigma factor (sigma-70 family)
MANAIPSDDPLWGTLREAVRHWAQRLIGPQIGRREDASDLAQAAVLSLFEEGQRLEGLAPEQRGKLARQILRRRLIDLIRRHHRRCRDVDREAPLAQIASTPSAVENLLGEGGPEPAGELARREHQARLVVALASLPEKEQAVIRRRYFDHDEWQAIADDFGVAASSVMRWCERGLNSLRRFYGEDLHP